MTKPGIAALTDVQCSDVYGGQVTVIGLGQGQGQGWWWEHTPEPRCPEAKGVQCSARDCTTLILASSLSFKVSMSVPNLQIRKLRPSKDE